jgi:hypothetical protein
MAGRDDLSTAAWRSPALPARRHFVWRVKVALASRGNGELRHTRELYPGMAVSGAGEGSRARMDPLSPRCMGSRRGRGPAAGRVGRETRDA